MQNGEVIAILSRQLKPFQENYCAHDLKLVTIIFCFKDLDDLFLIQTYETHHEMIQSGQLLTRIRLGCYTY